MTHIQRPVNLIASLIIQHGKPYTEHFVHEGDTESGPFTTDHFGYRWGKLKVELRANGSIFVEAVSTAYWDRIEAKINFNHYFKALDRSAIGGLTVEGKLRELQKQYYLREEDKAIHALVRAVYPHG